jgi:hypothetical protein
MLERGFSLVNLWWDCAESWCFAAPFWRLETMPRIEDLFFDDSHFGNRSLQTPL